MAVVAARRSRAAGVGRRAAKGAVAVGVGGVREVYPPWIVHTVARGHLHSALPRFLTRGVSQDHKRFQENSSQRVQ